MGITLRGMMSGCLAIGIFFGVLLTVAAGPLFRIVTFHDWDLSFEGIFTSIAGGATAAAVGVWILHVTRSSAKQDLIAHTARVTRLQIAFNRANAGVIVDHIEGLTARHAEDDSSLHPMFSIDASLCGMTLEVVPVQSLILLEDLDEATSRKIMMINIHTGNINRILAATLQHQAALVAKFLELPKPVVGGWISLTEGNLSAMRRAGPIYEDQLHAIKREFESLQILARTVESELKLLDRTPSHEKSSASMHLA